MKRTQAELVLLVALLVAAWLAVGTGDRLPSSRSEQPRGDGASGPQPVGGGLPERAQALRAYLARPRPSAPVRRDPFSFSQPSSPATGPHGRAPAAPVAAAPSRPEMALSGIAEDSAGGRPVRTAVISVAGQLAFAREGDRVLARFLVLRIAADAVQLKDEEGGEVFTLALK